MTTSRGADGSNSAAAFDARPAGARYPRPERAPEPATAAVDRPRFGTVVRGYERVEVDRYVGQVHHTVTRLRAELTEADDRRRRAEQRIEALENENRAVRARLEASPTTPDEGFGMRAERLLRLAEQEAAEVRSEAAAEAATLRQQGREDIERQRHEAEQALIARSSQFDEHASRRTTELQQREQQLAEQLTTARGEAEAVQTAARRAADQYRQRVEADAEQIRARVNAEVAQMREQASQELDRIAALESGVRAELRRLSTRLTHEIDRLPRQAREGEAGTEDASATDDGPRDEPGSEGAGAVAAAGAEARS